MLVKELLSSKKAIQEVIAQGWVRTRRTGKSFSFIEINDGSSFHNLQVIADESIASYQIVEELQVGAAVQIKGSLVESQGSGQKWEIQASEVTLLGNSDPSYPLQKKGHSVEFLREIAHLRPRTNLFGSVFRVRSRAAFAIHQFFQERHFQYIHTPIITASDCEGAGEMFQVTATNEKEPFFGKPTYLTVSGQLEGEAFATALGRIYTFGPTFRAENSNTSRHANEFWMIEPEMAFYDLEADMALAEEFIKAVVADVMEHCPDELTFFNKFVDKGLKARLDHLLETPFVRLPYREAVEILKKSKQNFQYPVEFGQNLQSEHERYLTEEHFKTPVTVFDYPKSIKPFYMRSNDDGKTVAAMDLLVSGIGEIIGGSQREERLDILEANMNAHELDMETYRWYLELRKFGSVPHSGFGLGFERLLMLITGVSNIRDVIPFARTPGNAEF